MSSDALSGHPDLLNRTLFVGDNLHFLRSLPSETVDLICTDPPFGKNSVFERQLKPALTREEKEREDVLLADWGIRNGMSAEDCGIVCVPVNDNHAMFSDMWSWENEVNDDVRNQIEDRCAPLAMLIQTVCCTHSESLAAYLNFLGIRLLEMRRVLKQEGTILVHCDQRAAHYLKCALDAIFGKEYFQNEIIWRYGKMSNPKERFANNHDTILRYTKSDNFTFNQIYGGDSEYKIRFAKDLQENKLFYGKVKHRNDKLILRRINNMKKDIGRDLRDDDVLFDFDVKFKLQDDVFTNVSIVKGNAKEYAGYPTQKPLELYKRLVEVASKTGDVVLDPFAGSGTTCVAAEVQDRKWVACDNSIRAMTVFVRQFAKLDDSVNINVVSTKSGLCHIG